MSLSQSMHGWSSCYGSRRNESGAWMHWNTNNGCVRRPTPEEERRTFRQREGRIAIPVTIPLDARKVTAIVDQTVLDRERGSRHVPIGHTFRRSTPTVGERISPKTILMKVAIQPFSPHKRFERDDGRHPDRG
jgi:hypothetical protein